MSPILFVILCGVGASLVGAGLALLLEHGCRHADPHDPANRMAHEESCAAACYFQPSDVRNHETWVLVLVTNGVTLLLTAAACRD